MAKFPKGPAWLLVGHCMGAVFQERTSIRSQVTMLVEQHKLHAANKSQRIWAVLQCHSVIASFSEVQFRGHTSTVKEMSLFMLTECEDPIELV